MRRRPTSPWRVRSIGTLVAAVALAGAAPPLRAQGGVSVLAGGGLELVLPVGARANGLGEAVVADYLGSEGIWWNPAGMGRETTREAAIHHSSTFAGTGDAITAVLPVAPVGVLALSVDLYSYGTQDNTDATGSYGTITPRATIFAATFAGHVGSRAYLGLNYKYYSFGMNCTGACGNLASLGAATTALDFGLQVRASNDSSLFVGVALRNVGPRLQFNDAPQADPLPTRLEVGVTYAPKIPSLGPDAQLRFGADIVNAIPTTNPGLRLGADLGWQHKLHARAGYVHDGPLGSGPTVGLGATTGRLRLDIAQLYTDSQGTAGAPQTYLSLRLVF
ncbi:MAG: PorV/PorQ family protein [Gemmatimonadota bacterium]|nr:PorV/PorQ family protein [Gemmatimonadota bacterium]